MKRPTGLDTSGGDAAMTFVTIAKDGEVNIADGLESVIWAEEAIVLRDRTC